MACYAISPFRNKRGQHSTASSSTHTESKHFQMFYRVHESQTSENMLSAFSLQVQGEAPWRGKELGDSLLTQFEAHTFMEQMWEMLFLNAKTCGVKTPLAALGLVVMKNTEICDSLPRTRMSPWEKVTLRSHLLTLKYSAQSVWL